MNPVFIYVIGRPEGPVKVGISVSPKSRLSQIQTSCPFSVELFFFAKFPDRDTALDHEGIFHRGWQDKKLIGEWFDMDAESAIEDLETSIEYWINPPLGTDWPRAPIGWTV